MYASHPQIAQVTKNSNLKDFFQPLPLCSPRKTNLNFLKGFPKFSEVDIALMV
jgi:hypothetical protein